MVKRNAVAFEVQPNDERCHQPGAYYFIQYAGEETPCGIIHACPCGCGILGSLRFRGRGRGGAEWDVTGEWPKVTLSPSIGFWGHNPKEQGFHWHGYLREGVFEEC